MRKIRLLAFTTAVMAVLLAISPVIAEDSPGAQVSQMFARIVQQQSPEPIIEYVDWKLAFTNLSAEERRQMDVKTPMELKSYVHTLLRDPRAFFEQEIKKRLTTLPDDKKQEVEAMLKEAYQVVDRKTAELKEKLSKTTFKVLDETVEGDAATVRIESTIDGRSEQSTIRLVRSNGQWRLPSIDYAKRQSGEPAAKGDI